MRLLEQALLIEATPRKDEMQHSEETLELAVAWVKGAVTAAQLNTVICAKRSAPVYAFVAGALRWGWSRRLVEVTYIHPLIREGA